MPKPGLLILEPPSNGFDPSFPGCRRVPTLRCDVYRVVSTVRREALGRSRVKIGSRGRRTIFDIPNHAKHTAWLDDTVDLFQCVLVGEPDPPELQHGSIGIEMLAYQWKAYMQPLSASEIV